MGQLGTKLRTFEGGLAHWCPACNEMHAFALDHPNSSGAKWTWDGDVESPTFNPSMNIRTNTSDQQHYQPDVESSVCHYKLVAGMITFGNDCTHAMKGQHIPLSVLPAHLKD